MTKKNLFYAQSGGVTSVINATACGVIETARQSGEINNVLAGKNGILGGLLENLIDTSQESDAAIAALKHTPGGAFGSCRYKLKDIESNLAEYQRLIGVFKAHDIGYFFYNGGGDSQDTTHKISQISKQLNHPLICIGLPKTVDNDLPITDNSPGFGSVAKYIATSIREVGLDVKSMAATSTKVFIMEVMGRHTGWIAAASGLAAENDGESPHIILFPEVAFNADKLFIEVKRCVDTFGFCTIVASEGLKDESGKLLSDTGNRDAFGHAQLGGLAPLLANKIQQALGYKYHWSVVDYLQRAARHLASQSDVEQAYALGCEAVNRALAGKTDVMLTIERTQQSPYQWQIGEAALGDVANVEKHMPAEYISDNGFHITQACRDYLAPLIAGEAYPPFKDGLPDYITLKNSLVPKKIDTEFEIS